MASILFLVLLIYILIQVPAVQNFARGKVVAFLEKKIKTRVEIAKLSLAFPKRLVLEGVYFEDQQKDTLLSGGKLQVDIALLKLISNKVEVNYVELKDVYANIYRKGTDTLFNYQYIIDAFDSGPSEAKPKDTSGGMQINVDKIVLKNIRASFFDNQTGIDFYVKLGDFETGFKQFDLDKMKFDLPEISLANVSGHMYQNKPLLKVESEAVIEAKSNEPFELQLGLKNLHFNNILFDYKNDVSLITANLKLGELSGKVKAINLATLDVQLEEVKLHNTNAGITLGKSEQTKVAKEEINKEVAAQANNPWKVSLAKLDFENNNISFVDNNTAPIPRGMDFKHLGIEKLKLKGNDFVFTPTSYSGNITEGGLKEKSGFNLQQFTTSFAYSDTGAALNNLYIQTDKTVIRDNLVVRYPSLEAVTKDMGTLYLDANFDNAALAAKDILIFAPQLQTSLKGNENAVINVNARVQGYLANLTIPNLQVSGIGNTRVSMSGTIKGLPDPNKTTYDFNIAEFATTKTDINNFVPPGTIPATVRIPEQLRVSGTFKGLATNFTTNLLLQTNKGNARLNGSLNSVAETYNLKGSLDNVDVGYLAKQDTLLGRVTMNFAAKGRGFTPSKMNSNVNAYVKSAYVMGYNYSNLELTGTVKRGYTVIAADMGDKSIAFNLHGEALIDDKFATNIKMRLLLDSILMKPLGLTANDLRIHGNLTADLATSDPNNPEGTIELSDLVVYNDGQRIAADTILINAQTSDTGKVITLQSQVATASLTGNYSLTTVATGAMQVINKYYNLGVKDTSLVNDKWVMQATVIPDSLLFSLVPTLAGTDTIKMRAAFDGAAEKLDLLVNAPKVQFGEQVIDSLTIVAGNQDDRFAYTATVNKAGTKSFELQNTRLSGFIANDELFSNLNIKDRDGKDKYQLGVKVAQEDNGAIRANLSDSLMMDYEKWAVDKSNYLYYDSTGIIVHQLNINNNGQSLSVNSQTESVTAPIAVALKDFHIKTLVNLAEQDSLFLDGTINGNMLVKNVMETPVFTADLRVDSLTYNTDTVGNIIVKIDNETANAFNADVAITGNGNDVKLTGKYFTGESKMDLRLAVNNFNLATLKPFAAGALTSAEGSLKGGVDIKGTADDPDLNGALHFENAYLTPTATGERLHLSEETISVSPRDISFDRFTILDSSGNRAVVNGKIFTEDFKTYRFDLNMDADDFHVLNAPKTQGGLYYGKLNMDAAISVDGTLTAPRVNADLKINRTTDIAFILPSTDPEIENREGVVEFVDVYGGAKDSVFTAMADTMARFTELAGLDITGTLQSDTAAQITLIIDERSGDALRIRGKANLSGGLDKSGKISLTGNYELQAGSYQLSLSLLKREFLIQPGSVITWTGDMMDANVDITARYIANTQPVNLLQSELANMSATDINKYKAKVPFNVLLMMKGELLQPQITFDIELPEDQRSKWADVETKLEQVRRDEAELNKQVFALLLLGRFIQENPMDNAAEGTSLAGTAKSSVSRILAEQLNNLAGSLITGVDLNFGVNTEDDFSSGTRTSRTDLTVGVSKKLLNDRLRVNVGSNFELEGPANNNQSASNIAGDVAVDYLLSKDGRYALRGYRRNRFEGVVEGQVIETGLSFMFTLDFNEFKQIFYKKTEEQKAQEKIDKAKEKALKKEEKKQQDKMEEEAENKGLPAPIKN